MTIRRTKRLATALILAGLAGVVAAPAPCAAAEKAIWGPLDLPNGQSAFDTYRALGVDTFQLQLRWSDTAPSRPADPLNPADAAYRWPSSVDRAISEAGRRGIGVALLVTRTPGWANGGRAPTHTPTDANDFAQFVQAASRRYPSVRKWMIWGEPNSAHQFQPAGAEAPRAYALLLDSAYQGLKRASRRNIVIGGMTWTGGDIKPAPFLSRMRLPSGRRPRLDWYGHNPFPFRYPNLREIPTPGGYRDTSDLDTFSKEIERAYKKPTPLWLSEFTLLSDKRSASFDRFVSQSEQARWLTAGFNIADSLPDVAGIGWLSLFDQASGPLSSNFGLMTASGAPKPAYAAFQQARNARLRPTVKVARRVRRTSLRGRGLRVRVRPRQTGRVTVELRNSKGQRIVRASRRFSRLGVRRIALRRKVTLRRGASQLLVRAPGGETVRIKLRVRK